MAQAWGNLARNPLWLGIGGVLTALTMIGLAFQAVNPSPLMLSVILTASFFILLLAYGSHLLARRMFVAAGHVRLQQAIIDHTLEAMFVTDAQQNILVVNPAFERITGYSAKEAVGNTPRMLSSGLHEPSFFVAMWRDLKEHGAWEGEIHDRHKNGKTYPKYLRINAIDHAGAGQPSHYVAVFVRLLPSSILMSLP